MIEPKHPQLSIVKQCDLLCLNRSSIYYEPAKESEENLQILHWLDDRYEEPRTTVSDPTKYKYPYLLKELKIARRNQVWALDITYLPMRKGFMYLCAIIDIYTRYVVGWGLSNSMMAEWVVGWRKRSMLTPCVYKKR